MSINVLRRVLSVAPTNEEEQRKNLFHIGYMVKGNLCSLIIDGGSYTNVASKFLVDKLSLPTVKHLTPYML